MEAVLEPRRIVEDEKEETEEVAEVEETEQERADREFALKLSQRLNDEPPQIPSGIVLVEEEVSSVPKAETDATSTPATSTEEEDYQLALRLSQELNADVAAPQQRPPPATVPVYVAPPTYVTAPQVYQIPPPARPAPLSQEEADKRLAMQLQQELNGDEKLDREIALRVSQELNGEVPAAVLVPPPPPPRTVYATPGRYVVVRSAEEIRVEGEIARISQALGQETDPDAKIALDLQLQELVAYQRQLQKRKIRNEYSDEDDDDVFEDGIKLLDAGYEKFKGFSKDVVQTLDRYGGKFEKAINKFAKKIIGEDGKEVESNGTGDVVQSETKVTSADEEPLVNSRRPASSELKDKGLSLKIVETIDKVTEEFGETVSEIIFGDKSKLNNSSNSNSAAVNSPPLTRSSSSVRTETTASTTTTTTSPPPPPVGSTGSGLTNFKGGDAKDTEDALYPL
eukprot:TRINITY_DN2826_c0_g1_i5.p2 TRINITY_DN2826_c0_g1~~TRINITY_DN2826_c0_g1_i5.p2  ORF type:complete len:454 (+),score=158.54 TRINITY_DN2826_c0_g1_i5:1647-3008(+)